MVTFLSLLILVFSSLSHASFSLPPIKWEKLTPAEKEFVLAELQVTMGELSVADYDEVSSFRFKFIQEAYASGYDCFLAGWPSQKNSSGSCQLPEKNNPHYKRYMGCPAGQVLCNPALFGDGLCARFSTTTEKNTAYAQCEKQFIEEDRSFSEIIEYAPTDEFNELIVSVNQRCNEKPSSLATCNKLKGRLEKFLLSEEPVSYKTAEEELKKNDPEKLLNATERLQNEMEHDALEFSRVCENSVYVSEQLYCKNLALRVKKANAILPKMFSKLNQLVGHEDCINCSLNKKTTILDEAAMPDLNSVTTLQCNDGKKVEQKCDEAVMCSIGSLAATYTSFISEGLLGKKANSCINSQNSCVTNIVSSIIKSLVNLVTGIWDLLSMAVDWTSSKLSDFWNYVRGVEDKTADAQNVLNKMTDAEINKVKTNPIEWVKNLASNMWQGIKLWVKEDVFCQQWAGVPRMSSCLAPSQGWDCMDCQRKINGICSATGVVLAEVIPSFLTGGAVNLVSKAGSGARAFTKVIQASKNFQKVASAVDKLGSIKSIQVSLKVVSAPIKISKALTLKPLSKVTLYSAKQLSSGYKAFVSTKAFIKSSKAMDVAIKYTGLKAIGQINSRMYGAGYKFVDNVGDLVSGTKVARVPKLPILSSNIANQTLKEEKLKPFVEDMTNAYKKGGELSDLKYELMDLKKIASPTPEDLKRMTEIEKKFLELKNEITVINDAYLNKVHALYLKEGIPSRLVKGGDGSLVLQLDFTAAPTQLSAYEFYRRVKNRFGLDQVTLSLKGNAEIGAAGFFSDASKRIDMGPSQGFSLLDDYFNSVSKHESRHSMFSHMRATGDDSIFHTRFYASPTGDLLNADKVYDTFMSAEELYTFSTDLKSLAQVFKGDYITDLAKQKGLLIQIEGSNDMLKRVSKANQTVADEMVKSLDELLVNPDRIRGLRLHPLEDGNFSLHITDKLKRQAELTLVSSADKQLGSNLLAINKKLTDHMNEVVSQKIVASGKSPADLLERIQTGKASADEMASLTQFSQEAIANPRALEIFKELDEAVIPLISSAKNNMVQLRTLAKIQVKESQALEKVLKQYSDKTNGGKIQQLEAIKAQMFKTAKNVNEDYKGFALNNLPLN